MKLRGFRPHAVVPGVEVWENDVFEVPLRRVLAGHLVSAEPARVTGPDDDPEADVVPARSAMRSPNENPLPPPASSSSLKRPMASLRA